MVSGNTFVWACTW